MPGMHIVSVVSESPTLPPKNASSAFILMWKMWVCSIKHPDAKGHKAVPRPQTNKFHQNAETAGHDMQTLGAWPFFCCAMQGRTAICAPFSQRPIWIHMVETVTSTMTMKLGPPLISDPDTALYFSHSHGMECWSFQWDKNGTIKQALKRVVPLVEISHVVFPF